MTFRAQTTSAARSRPSVQSTCWTPFSATTCDGKCRGWKSHGHGSVHHLIHGLIGSSIGRTDGRSVGLYVCRLSLPTAGNWLRVSEHCLGDYNVNYRFVPNSYRVASSRRRRAAAVEEIEFPLRFFSLAFRSIGTLFTRNRCTRRRQGCLPCFFPSSVRGRGRRRRLR